MSRLAISLLAFLAGIAAFTALVIGGMPHGKSVLPGRRTKSVSTTRSHCSSECRGRERTERRVSISSRPPAPADQPSLVERAVDNDGGVLVIRFLIALSTALTTAVTLERLFGRRDPGDLPGSEPDAEPKQDDSGSNGGETLEPGPPPAPAEGEREERAAQMHEVAVNRQALLKAAMSRRPKIRIKIKP